MSVIDQKIGGDAAVALQGTGPAFMCADTFTAKSVLTPRRPTIDRAPSSSDPTRTTAGPPRPKANFTEPNYARPRITLCDDPTRRTRCWRGPLR